MESKKIYENKKLLNNVFLNKKFFPTFFNLDMRKKRLDDIYFLSTFYYKNKLCIQKKEYAINEKLLKKWINAHKTEEDKKIAEKLIKPIVYVSFSDFIENLIKSVNKFNRYLEDNKIKNYYLIIGANNGGGSNFMNYLDIGKSNFWTLLIILPYLKIKPHDILLNLKQAIDFSIFEKLKNKINIVDYVFADDASYSGLQLFEHTIKDQLFEKYFYNGIFVKQDVKPIEKNDLDKIKMKKSSLIKIQNDVPNINLHIIIPYLSITSRDISLNIQYKNNIAIHLHNSYFINNYKNYYGEEVLKKMSVTYGEYGFRDTLTPLYFSHKMPDGVSTIDYILLSGIISNYSDVINSQKNNDKKLNEDGKKNIDEKKFKKKFIQFIDNCIYPKNKIIKPSSLERWECNKLCPISPYKTAKIFIEKRLKKIV